MIERKLRIWVAITTFFPLVGGAETQTLAQCQRLREHGYATRIVTFRYRKDWSRQEEVGDIPTQRVAGFFLNNRKKLPRLLQRLLYLPAMLVMSWTIWRHRKEFDVLQVCQCSLLVLPLAVVCLLAHKPMTIVLISAGADQATKTNEQARLIAGPLDPASPWLKVAGETWIDGDLYGLQSAGPFIFSTTRALLKRVQAVIIVLSNRMKRYLRENDFELPDTICIPNGVDTDRFQPAISQPQGEGHAHTVVCVSNLRYEKGIDVLLQAWRIVHEQIPEARLIIIGDGSLREQFEKMAFALGISESIELAGRKSDIPHQLHRGAISVLPSRWEGMPNALLEAMASGMACVATQVSGSEELIQHGLNGLLVPPEDYEQMARALITLLRDPELVHKYGFEARHTVEQYYTLNHVTHQYVEVYQNIINEKQRNMHITSWPQKERVAEG